jgi:serine phosphatase RsbU (regulator of sigma subunit)
MISDVSGHGVAPAFITALIKSSFDYLVPRKKGPAARLITDLIQFMKDPYFEDDITNLFGQVIETL